MPSPWFTADHANRAFFVGLARAFAGSLIFGLPMLMTMEMWWLGFHTDRLKLALLLVVTIPVLIGLSYFGGFKETDRFSDDVVDAFVGVGVAFVTAALVLGCIAILRSGMSLDEVFGKIAIQVFPAGIGALLARAQLGGQKDRRDERHVAQASYGGELFIMAAGALFLSLNLAPTEEMMLIAYQMTVWHELALVLASLLLMHAFVYRLEFHGQASVHEAVASWSVFLRFTVVGYALVLLIALYILWTFDRTGGMAPEQVVSMMLVVGFPGAIGAAAARLII